MQKVKKLNKDLAERSFQLQQLSQSTHAKVKGLEVLYAVHVYVVLKVRTWLKVIFTIGNDCNQIGRALQSSQRDEGP